MADFSSIFSAIPPVTRVFLLGTAIITGPCLLQLISPADVAWSWWRITRFYEIWRPITTFFYGGGGFPLLYDFFLIYRNSSALERDVFLNDTAQYAWLHIMLGIFIHCLNIPFGLPFLFRPLLHAQTYIWCRSNATLKVSIFGLITIPTSLYPPALILLDVLTGGPTKALGGVLGVLSGHTWWYFETYLPSLAPPHLRRPNPFGTPARFRALFSGSSPRSTSTAWGGSRLAPTAGATTATRTAGNNVVNEMRYRWGSGQRLGGNPL
ncbi:Der1-like family-domain-containing protein [Naematelia encephala]|uniref:Derlin n=1 Tax=Naematelia encephala TaxID=71784 RepID=A0A1Y2AGP5_9TREE|nr:Der1-like family-domain-containing protein [Naematelia encephala]